MPAATACLPRTDLEAYLQGDLDEAASAAAEHHLNICSDCRHTLALMLDSSPKIVSEPTRQPADGKHDVSSDGNAPVAAAPKELWKKLAFESPHSPQPAPINLLPPRYIPVRRIGGGGMGEVWEVRDCVLDRAVAVKLLRGSNPGLQEIQRMLKEAHALGRLGHPGIVHMYEVLVDLPVPAILMELVNGPSLSGRIRGRAVPDKEAAGLVSQLCDAVSHAHQEGVLHRDLKPSNVLLRPLSQPAGDFSEGESLSSFQPLISDFGTARFSGDQTVTLAGQIVGTPAYMSPEQARGEQDQLTPAVDIYGLGCILYELLTARPPYLTDNAAATLELVKRGDLPAPRVLQPRISRDLENICLKCLATDPRDRYATAKLLQQDLQAFLNQRPVSARSLSVPARLIRWSRRNKSLATLTVVLAAATVAIVAQSLHFGFAQKRLVQQATAAETRAVNNARLYAERTQAVEVQLQDSVRLINQLLMLTPPPAESDNSPGAMLRRRLHEEGLKQYAAYINYFCPWGDIPELHLDTAIRYLWLKLQVDPRMIRPEEVDRLLQTLSKAPENVPQDEVFLDLRIYGWQVATDHFRAIGDYRNSAAQFIRLAQTQRQKSALRPRESREHLNFLRSSAGMLLNAINDLQAAGEIAAAVAPGEQACATLSEVLNSSGRDQNDVTFYFALSRQLTEIYLRAGDRVRAMATTERALRLLPEANFTDPELQAKCQQLAAEMHSLLNSLPPDATPAPM